MLDKIKHINNLEVELKVEISEINLKTSPETSPVMTKKQITRRKTESTCHKCFKKFETRKKLYQHKSIAHDVVKCIEKHKFKYDENLKLFLCNTCSATFQEKDQVEEHISKIHDELYTCEVCQNIFTTAFNFALHMKKHSEDRALSCPLCSYTTVNQKCLQMHINQVHYHKFYYHCATCGKGFNDPAFYKDHNNEHLGIKAFTCVVCKKKFKFTRYLNIHQTTHHTVHIEGILIRNQCSICLKVFSKNHGLRNHLNNKHSKKPDHLCDICGRKFSSTYKLNNHYRKHTGEKPFSCSYCDKSFTKKDYLVSHERIHTGEKPFSCKYCNKCFNQSASLRIHVRSHTGERPYICQLCNGGYISRGSLNMHQKICNGTSIN